MVIVPPALLCAAILLSTIRNSRSLKAVDDMLKANRELMASYTKLMEAYRQANNNVRAMLEWEPGKKNRAELFSGGGEGTAANGERTTEATRPEPPSPA